MKKLLVIVIISAMITTVACGANTDYMGKTNHNNNNSQSEVTNTLDAASSQMPISTHSYKETLKPDAETSTNKPIETTEPTGNQENTAKPTASVDDLDSDITVITNLLSLRDYLNDGLKQGIRNFKFRYTGEENVDCSDIARMTCALYVEGIIWEQEYDIEISKYPGDKMLAAYFSSDYSKLTAEEKQTLEQAIDMVDKAKANSSNMFELELNIYDMLVDSITYIEANHDFYGVENAPRSLTAIGALRDKRANCQGYTDAFYLLGTIAGLEVDRAHVNTPEGFHMANAIKLDNQWYIVDLTYNDKDEEYFKNYALFNAGCDVLNDYYWNPEWEYNPIAKSSSNYFYYKNKNAIYKDINAMVDAIISKWNGTELLIENVMVLTEATNEEVSDALDSRLDALGVEYDYTYWYKNNGKYSFFTVKISN